MKVGILGAGKVGWSIGKYLVGTDASVTGYYSKTYESAKQAATFTDSKAFESMEALIEASDTLFITTPDGVIGDIWDCIAKYELKDKVICHFSGSLSSDVFSGIEETKAFGCSVHPMYAFCDKFTSYQQLNTAYLTMEGNPKAIARLKPFFEQLGHKVFVIKATDKIQYHAAAAFASNYMVGLMQISLNLLEVCGFSEENARELLGPLVSGNLASIMQNGCIGALTGPIERNDVLTVEKHLGVLDGLNAELVYRSIGKELVDLAEKRNPERDYGPLKAILTEKKESDSASCQEKSRYPRG